MATVCKGTWERADCCGECPKCKATARQAVHKIRQQRAEIGRLRDTEPQKRIEALEAEIVRLRGLVDDGVEARIASLKHALADLLGSADALWEEKRMGHDWAEACQAARKALRDEAGPVARSVAREAFGAGEEVHGPG